MALHHDRAPKQMRERKHVEGHFLGRWSARGEFEPLPLDLGLLSGEGRHIHHARRKDRMNGRDDASKVEANI